MKKGRVEVLVIYLLFSFIVLILVGLFLLIHSIAEKRKRMTPYDIPISSMMKVVHYYQELNAIDDKKAERGSL